MFKKIIQALTWLGKKFVDHVVSAAPVAVTITEGIKAILASPEAGILEKIADIITGTNIPTAVANDINALIPKALAAELAIEGLPVNPTEADILAFEQRVMSAFNINSNNSKLYTMLSAQIYGILQSAPDTKFATLVDDIEQIYTDYKKDIAANAVSTT